MFNLLSTIFSGWDSEFQDRPYSEQAEELGVSLEYFLLEFTNERPT